MHAMTRSHINANLLCAIAGALTIGCAGKPVHTQSPSTSVASSTPRSISGTPADRAEYRPLLPDDKEGKGPLAAVVFGELGKRAPIGLLIKVPAGADPGPHTHSSDYRGVVITGVFHHYTPGQSEGPALTAGATWFTPRDVIHENHCEAGEACLLYMVFDNGFDANFATPPAAAH